MRVVLDPNRLGGMVISFPPSDADLSLAVLKFLIEYGQCEGWDTSEIVPFLAVLETPIKLH